MTWRELERAEAAWATRRHLAEAGILATVMPSRPAVRRIRSSSRRVGGRASGEKSWAWRSASLTHSSSPSSIPGSVRSSRLTYTMSAWSPCRVLIPAPHHLPSSLSNRPVGERTRAELEGRALLRGLDDGVASGAVQVPAPNEALPPRLAPQ